MSREKSLWGWLSKEEFDGLDMTRIENRAAEGTPDVEGCFDKAQFWCELKVCDRPKRPTTPCRPKVRDGQVEWLTRRWKVGGLAWMLIQVGERHKAARYLVPGKYAFDVQMGMAEADLARIAVLHPEVNRFTMLKRMTWR